VSDANSGAINFVETAMPTHVPARDIADSGKVKLGGWSPSLPQPTTPANVRDAAKVRLGGWGPSLPRKD
jgi:hypothetical protein